MMTKFLRSATGDLTQLPHTWCTMAEKTAQSAENRASMCSLVKHTEPSIPQAPPGDVVIFKMVEPQSKVKLFKMS